MEGIRLALDFLGLRQRRTTGLKQLDPEALLAAMMRAVDKHDETTATPGIGLLNFPPS